MTDQAKRQKLMDKAFELGFEYEKVYRGCSQCTIAAIQDVLDIREDNIFKSATALAGGGGLTGIGYCGGYVAAVMVLGQLMGRERDNFEDPDKIALECHAITRDFTADFIKEFGTIICRDLQTIRFGRAYYISDPDEYRKFEDAGGHVDKCTTVVGQASRLAVKFILDQGLLEV